MINIITKRNVLTLIGVSLAGAMAMAGPATAFDLGNVISAPKFRVEVYNHTGQTAEIRGGGLKGIVVKNGKRAIDSQRLGDHPTYRAYEPGTRRLLGDARKAVNGNITVEIR